MEYVDLLRSKVRNIHGFLLFGYIWRTPTMSITNYKFKTIFIHFNVKFLKIVTKWVFRKSQLQLNYRTNTIQKIWLNTSPITKNIKGKLHGNW